MQYNPIHFINLPFSFFRINLQDPLSYVMYPLTKNNMYKDKLKLQLNLNARTTIKEIKNLINN